MMIRRLVNFSNRKKVLRGMLAYGTLWPCASLVEQTLIEKRTYRNYDWMKCLRFSVFGAFFMGPTLYVWIRLAAIMWPKQNLKTSLFKVFTETISYDPMAISAFHFTMSVMEGKTYEDAKLVVGQKFCETYKVGVIFWPCLQIVNFTFIPQRNQVVFVSFFSLMWTSFLAYKNHSNVIHSR